MVDKKLPRKYIVWLLFIYLFIFVGNIRWLMLDYGCFFFFQRNDCLSILFLMALIHLV